MRRLLRQFRRPVVIMAGLYLAFVGVLWGLLPYQPAMILPRRDFPQMLVGFSPDGRRLAVGPRISHLSVVNPRPGHELSDEPFEIWDLANDSLPTRLPLPVNPDDDFLFVFGRNPGGRRFFWSYIDNPEFRRRVALPRVWGADANDPEWRGRLPTLNTAACQFSPDGRLAALYEVDGSAVIAEWPAGRMLVRLPATVESLVFLPGGRIAVSVQLTFPEPDQHARYRVSRWDLNTGRPTAVTDWDAGAKADGGLAPGYVQLSCDGRWLVDIWSPRAAGETPPGLGLVVWNTENGQKRLTVPLASWYRLARNGRTLATLHDTARRGDSRLTVFDFESGEGRPALSNDTDFKDSEFEGAPESVASPDGELLAVVLPNPRPDPLAHWPKLVNRLGRLGIRLERSDSFVALLQVGDGRELASLPFGPSLLFSIPELSDIESTIAFSPDGRRLAVLGEDAIRIWDLPVRRPWVLILSLAAIPSAAFAMLFLAIHGLRRLRTPRPALPSAV